MVGTSNQSVPESWPLTYVPIQRRHGSFGESHARRKAEKPERLTITGEIDNPDQRICQDETGAILVDGVFLKKWYLGGCFFKIDDCWRC